MQIKEAIIHAAHTASQKIQAAAKAVSGSFCCYKANVVHPQFTTVASSPNVKISASAEKSEATITIPAKTNYVTRYVDTSLGELKTEKKALEEKIANTRLISFLQSNAEDTRAPSMADIKASRSLHDRMLALRRAQLTELTDKIADLESQVAKEMAAGFGQDDVAPQGDLEIVKL